MQRVVCSLLNWKEVGFKKPVEIFEEVGTCGIDQSRIERYGWKYSCRQEFVIFENRSDTIAGLKRKIRQDNSVKGKTLRFKWGDT